MKRSEMIQIMIDADKQQSSCRSLHHTFSHILEALEAAGMLPPPIDVEIEGNRGYRTYKRNQWDEE